MATTTAKIEPWRFPLARMAWPELAILGGGLGILALLGGFYSFWTALPPALLALFVVMFFRDPPRSIPLTPGAMVAPADGVVTHVEELADAGIWPGPAVRISIYLSIFNVHLNRVPEHACVLEVCYRPGRFHDTRHAALSTSANEQCWTLFACEGRPERRLLVKQIAGTFARRIVCLAHPGQVLARGERFGMIKFGSRTELYLTPESGLRVCVQPGDRVRGGSSILAQYANW
jgi:phosphatidylserine decarboxylase